MLRSVTPRVYRALHAREGPWLAVLCGGLLLLLYGVVFLPLLPNRDGSMGHDYAYWLPNLLAGYFWFRESGLWEIPWFTPAFCGGIPYFPNPQIGYFAVPQVLTLALPPVAAIRATMLAFAALGYAGTYMLLRRTLGLGTWGAVLGGGLFMFNGFFAHRMLIGHLSFHAFMLIPLTAWLLLPASRDGAWRGRLGAILGGGLAFAYMFHSGMVHLIPLAAAAVAGIAMIAALCRGWKAEEWRELLIRSGGATVLALSLSAARLAAAIAFLRQFPRDLYSLPGMGTPWEAFLAAFQSLFFGPAHELVNAGVVNAQWALDRHELEFGITILPLPLLLAGVILMRRTWAGEHRPSGIGLRRILPAAGLLVLLVLPVILNWYTPTWNLILKQVPFVRSSSNLFRWFALYIPLLIVMAALAFDRWKELARFQPWIATGGLAVVAVLNLTADRAYYAGQGYFPERIEAAYARLRGGEATPGVDRIALPDDPRDASLWTLDRNDVLADGASQGAWYEPMFGYRLETFPFKQLRDGPIGVAEEGVLNIKKPACLVYPEENACLPGDHYAVGEVEAAESFARYKPVEFSVPPVQTLANWINIAALAGLPLLAAVLVRRRRRD